MQTEQESHVLASKLFSAFFIKEHFLPTEVHVNHNEHSLKLSKPYIFFSDST